MSFSLFESDLNFEQKQYADNALQNRETLLWAGKPVCKLPTLMMLNSVILLGVFAFVLWQIGGSSLLGTLLQADSVAALLAGLPILAILSALLIVGVGFPLWYLYRLANSFYLITDRRYLSVCRYPLLGFRQREWTGTPLSVTVEKDGTGDIVMEYRVRKNKGNVSLNPIGLLHIPNIARVRELTAELMDTAATETEEETEVEEETVEAKESAPKVCFRKRGVIFLTLAAAAWAYGLFSAVQTHERLSSWKRAEGVVFAQRHFSHHGRHGSHSTYRARFRFVVDGVRYEGLQSVASNPPAHYRGEKVAVVYNPADPREADIDSAFDLYFTSLGCGFAGVVLFLIGFSASGGWSRLKGLAFWRSRA